MALNWKEWPVFRKGTGALLGYVRAERKGWAALMAERDFKVRPGEYYLGTRSA
jgi:hypothetical protein